MKPQPRVPRLSVGGMVKKYVTVLYSAYIIHTYSIRLIDNRASGMVNSLKKMDGEKGTVKKKKEERD